jgi:hypothetical protein
VLVSLHTIVIYPFLGCLLRFIRVSPDMINQALDQIVMEALVA